MNFSFFFLITYSKSTEIQPWEHRRCLLRSTFFFSIIQILSNWYHYYRTWWVKTFGSVHYRCEISKNWPKLGSNCQTLITSGWSERIRSECMYAISMYAIRYSRIAVLSCHMYGVVKNVHKRDLFILFHPWE